MQCVEAFTEIRPSPDYDAPGAFTLAKESRVRDILNTAGFTDIDVVAHKPNLFVGGTVSEAAELFMAMNSIQTLLREADDTLEERVLQHMCEGLRDYQQDMGVYMKSACWLISAKPQS